MDIETALAGATPRQRDFIATLLAERDYTLGETRVDSPKEASALIDKILRAPKRIGAVRVVDKELAEALSAVQKSKYAIPTSELILDVFDENVTGDLLFVEVREYSNTLYIRRLHGSVGDFTRSRLSRRDSLAILSHIAQDSYKYAKLFGSHFRCCGKCGAPLTDERSRQLQLGPDCRKAFGF